MDSNVQPEVVATTTPSTPQPLSEDMTKAINEAVAQATKIALREIQSVKDKSKAEIESARSRAQEAEEALSAIKGVSDDPEIQSKTELAELKARDRQRTAREQQTQAEVEFQKFDNEFTQSLKEFATEVGVKPDDKRIDWAEDSKNYMEKRKRFDKSVTKILTEERKSSEDALTKKIRAELGLDSVDTDTPPAPKKNEKMDARDYIRAGLVEAEKKRIKK